MVTHSRRTIVVEVLVIIDPIVVDVEIDVVGNAVVIVVVNVSEVVAITDFFIIIDSITIIVIIFNICDAVVVVIKW